MISKLINRFYEWLFRNGIRKQMMLIVGVALLVPTLTIGAILSGILLKNTLRHSQDQMWSDNLRVRSLLLDCLLDINSIADDLTSDQALQQLLAKDFSSSENIPFELNSYARIRNYHDTKTFISEIEVYTDNPTITDARFIKRCTDAVNENFVSLLEYPADIVWCEDPDNGELTMIRPIPLVRTDTKAYLLISISNNYLKNRIRNNDLYTALSLNQSAIFFSTTRSDQGKDLSVPACDSSLSYSQQGLYAYNSQKVFGCINYLNLPKTDDILYIETLDFSLLPALLKLLFLSSLIIIFSFLVGMGGIIVYTKALAKRIAILKMATHQASLGDYNIMDTFKGRDELSDTFLDIKQMIRNVQETEAKVYEEQLRKEKYENTQREMEFKLLTSQINPHFIYNTLEMIRMMALANQDRSVSDTVSMLGKCLHYVLENTISTKATIAQELDHIRNYLKIQKMRFDERFDYSINIPDVLDPSRYQILPLLLQPLVENAIVHGMEDLDRKCQIDISLTLSSDHTLLIEVKDDGTGMSPDALERLNESFQNPNPEIQSSIALINIVKRIHLFYGEEYYLTVKHNHPSGTIVELSIPLIPSP